MPCYQAFFGVFDGHGGAKAAEFAARNMKRNILDEVLRRGDNEIEEAVKHGYLNTDSNFLEEDLRGGSCCLTALIRNGNLVVSNAGDCRAVLSKGGIAKALTSDHRPSREDEKTRIEKLVRIWRACFLSPRNSNAADYGQGCGYVELQSEFEFPFVLAGWLC